MPGLLGPIFGPSGSASCEVEPAGAQGHQADNLSMVYWCLSVMVKNAKVQPHSHYKKLIVYNLYFSFLSGHSFLIMIQVLCHVSYVI